jgi:beta-N-acetylhexosaminidase
MKTNRRPKISFLLPILILLYCCNNQQQEKNLEKSATKFQHYPVEKPETKIPAYKNRQWNIGNYYDRDKLLQKKVDSIYQKLSNSEKAAQMIMAATSEDKGFGLPFSDVLKLYKSHVIGSVLFLKGKRSTFTNEIFTLNKISADKKILPAVFACDCEPSLFHIKFTDADSLTATSQLKNTDDVQKVVTLISKEMKEMGIHWNFAPVADINTNKEIIKNRSFGADNAEVINKSIAFIKTSTDNNIATSIKHFPGHGAVKGDSHKNLVFIDSTLTELDNFDSIIRQTNPVSVMIGHIAIKNHTELSTSGKPATLSKNIVTGLLKKSLGFEGIVITDAMNMGAVRNIEDADFQAVKAGNDLILIPQNIPLLHKKLMKLLETESESKKSISASIKKIIRLKICLGILNNY